MADTDDVVLEEEGASTPTSTHKKQSRQGRSRLDDSQAEVVDEAEYDDDDEYYDDDEYEEALGMTHLEKGHSFASTPVTPTRTHAHAALGSFASSSHTECPGFSNPPFFFLCVFARMFTRARRILQRSRAYLS